MSQQQELSPSVLQAAARVAFFNSTAKQRVVSCIVKSKGAQAAQVSLQQAAQAAFLPARDVLLLLKSDPCFKIVQAAGAGGGGAAQYCVELNVSALLSRAKGATSTGVLTEELPPPKGFVQGKHPIRPGQPDCKHYVKFGECAYNERCVFNHPGKPSPPQHKQQQQQHKPDQQPPAAPKAPAPPPQTPAWGGAGVRQAAVGGGEVADAGSNGSTAVPPTLTAPVSTVSSSSSPHNDVPSMPSSLPDTSDRQQAKDQQQPTPQQQQQQQPAQPAQLQQQQQPAPEQQQQPAQPAQAQRLPPGFGLQHFQSRPCQLMLLRGFCPLGDKCPYDHSRVTGVSTQPAAGQQPVPHISTAAAAANGSSTQGESPLAAAAEPVTPESAAAAAAAAAVPAAPAPAGAGPAADPAGQAASSSSSNSSTKAGGQCSWRQLLVPEAAQQQEPPPPQQQQHVEPASQSDPAASVGAGAEGGEQLGKLLGWTEDGLPQLRGVANCQFFMGTGSCKFKERCVYHHPAGADHPQCILRGQLPTRFNANNKAPYARLVSHLYRLWDYDSCVEAQLKVWLAKHLLAKNNPECHMWSASASKTAVYHVGRGFWWQPVGPYTCTMAEAGELLHELWRSQPDAASQEAFPYKKKLRELLADDPYFSVVADSKNSSLHWVKLELHKIKGMLNF